MKQVHTEDPQTFSCVDKLAPRIWVPLDMSNIGLYHVLRFVLNYYIVRLVQLELNVCDGIKNVEA